MVNLVPCVYFLTYIHLKTRMPATKTIIVTSIDTVKATVVSMLFFFVSVSFVVKGVVELIK